MKHIFFILLLFLAFTACGDKSSVTDVLDRAETLMDEHPDSSLTLLRTLTLDDFQQGSNRARYALLHSQALDKNYMDVTSDSLISVAVDYYKDENEVRNKFLSYYYMGRVHANGERYHQATSCLMEAEQLAEEVGDDYLSGLLYSEMGRIYDIYYDYPKSLEAYQKAANCYERARMISHRNYMMYYQSAVCRNMNKYDKAEQLLQKTLTLAKEEGDDILLRSCIGDLIMLYVELNRRTEALRLYEQSVLIQEEFGTSSFMGTLATLYASEGDFAKAESYLKRGWERTINRTDSICLYLSSSEVRNLSNNKNVAYQELLKGVSLQNKETRQALQQPVLTAQRDYLSEKVAFEAYRLQMEKRQNLLSVLFLVLLLIVSVYVFYQLLKRNKEKSSQVIHHLESEKKQVEEENDRISILLEQLDKDKKEADLTIKSLKDEIVKEEQRTNTEISSLMQNIKQGQGSIEELKLKLEQNEESRIKMQALVQKMESDSEAQARSVDCLRAELDILSEEKKKLMFQKVELLRNDLEHIADFIFLYEDKWPDDKLRIKRLGEKISLLKLHYFTAKNESSILEKLVNVYLDDVMLHFRREVELPDEADYLRVCCMFAGMSAPSIGRIMGESKEAIYQRKRRLVKKIASLSCRHQELFTQLLHRQL